MKIKYEFITGEVVEVEANDEIGMFITESRLTEETYERKMRYHCYSLDGTDDKSEWQKDYESDPYVLIEKEFDDMERVLNIEKMKNAYPCLTDKQKKLLIMIFQENKSLIQAAKELGINKATVSRRYEAALKKLRKNM